MFCLLQLAISLTTKAASLARELKTIKSELSFVQERCNLLEEENKRLREGFEKGVRPEEDELVLLFYHFSCFLYKMIRYNLIFYAGLSRKYWMFMERLQEIIFRG